MDGAPQELELTPDLLAYAEAVAIKEARKHCRNRASYREASQNAILHLLQKPPKFDPSRGASEKTFIYTIVQRAVIRFAMRDTREASAPSLVS